MKFNVHLTPFAEYDIREILDRTRRHFGDVQHDQYLSLIKTALDEISLDPWNSRSRNASDVMENVRTQHISRRGQHARHLILYRIKENQTILIARILHDSMDLEARILEEFSE